MRRPRQRTCCRRSRERLRCPLDISVAQLPFKNFADLATWQLVNKKHIGQIEGGFIQGMGWLTTEQLVWNDKGHLTTHAPSTYKIPATGDIPEHFKVDLWPEPNTEDNVFGSKAVGEPPLMLAISVYEALRDAVASTKADGQLVEMNAPATSENVLHAIA